MNRTVVVIIAALGGAPVLSGCSGDYGPRENEETNRLERLAGPAHKRKPEHTVFGDIGVGGSVAGTSVEEFGVIASTEEGLTALPVNKYLWQASLDVLSFMPLNSTDPFTGVIATDWMSAPDAPGERFKVTAYMLHPALSSASLRIAVFREARAADGLWAAAPVDPATARKVEDAILTRARQIRVASQEQEKTG